jgi:hypothetical protein
MKIIPPSTSALLAALTLCLTPLPALAQTAQGLRVAEIERLPGSLVRLTFEDAGTNGIVNYVPAHLFNLDPGTTNCLDPTARIVDLGGGRYQTVIPDPAQPQAFFRIAGFTGADTDGDGLSDALEAWLGTNPNTYDTDGDGFGDGVELVHGSVPRNAASKPAINLANFTAMTSAAREGEGTIGLRVTFSLPFTGTLHYRVADMSTAVSGEDFAPVSGTVAVTGTNALIPLTLLDDTNMEPTKLLAVDLAESPTASYLVGGASRQTVLLYDNDTHWSGVMRTPDSAELGFRLRMLRAGGSVVAAALVSELSTNSSQGVGTIPLGVWPVTAALTANSFSALSAPIPMGTSLLTGSVPLQRVLTFTATAGATNSLVRSNMLVGQFTDTLSSSQAGMAWVGGSVTGLVILLEDLPLPPSRQSPAGARLARAKGGAQ